MLPKWGMYEDPSFREEARALVPDAMILDEVLEGVRFELTRDPTSGKHLAEGIWWTVAGPLPTGETVAIVYTFDDKNVTLHEIWPRARQS